MRTYKQLIYEQRCQIAVLNGTAMTQQEIADAGSSQSKFSRELRRNRSLRAIITSWFRNWLLNGMIVWLRP